jgi:hypothetical protein
MEKGQVARELATLIFDFFVTDRVASKEVSIEYCPTGDMTADFFTKPLQGSQFKNS